MMPTATWKRLRRWHGRIADVVPAGSADECQEFFDRDRLRLEVLFDRGIPLEVRIPCHRGELYPVGSGRWAWAGPGGHWARKVMACLGEHASGPWGTEATAGSRHDESVIWFPAGHLHAVAEAVGARHRAHAGNLANLAGEA